MATATGTTRCSPPTRSWPHGSCSTWTVVLQAHALAPLARELTAFEATRATGRDRAPAASPIEGSQTCAELLLVDGVLPGYGLFTDDGASSRCSTRGTRGPGCAYSLLPMIHAIADDLLTPDEARHHLDLIARAPARAGRGAAVRPAGRATPADRCSVFQRAEASTFFGREIGLMYMHAHLRYAEALARVGDGRGLLRALALAQPVGIDRPGPRPPGRGSRPATTPPPTRRSPTATPPTSTTAGIADGSGPAGRRLAGVLLRARPVRPAAGAAPARAAGARGSRSRSTRCWTPTWTAWSCGFRCSGGAVRCGYTVGPPGTGSVAVRAGSRALRHKPLTNPYRDGGVSVRGRGPPRPGRGGGRGGRDPMTVTAGGRDRGSTPDDCRGGPGRARCSPR